MKKIILLLGFIALLGAKLFAQDSVTIATGSSTIMPDTAKVTFSKVYTDVKEGLKGLGSALKVGAEHVYTILVKQQLVYSITNMIVYIIFAFIGYFFLKRLGNVNKPENKTGYGSIRGHIMATLVLSGIGTVVGIIFVLITLNITIAGFVNPEYGAIKDIMEFVNGHN